MPRKFRLSPRVLTDAFWETMFLDDDARGPERQALRERLKALEGLRSQADYDTGTVNFAAAWCLYALVRFFAVSRAIEVGTFIGKSTLAMASAMDDEGLTGEIATCDISNAITLPWDGRAALRQFPKTASAEMLRALEGTYDFVFLDGRLAPEDLDLLGPRITNDTIVALDDFEGVEKGVANATLLSRLPALRSRMLIYPASAALLARYGFTGGSLMAVLLPLSLVEVARQG